MDPYDLHKSRYLAAKKSADESRKTVQTIVKAIEKGVELAAAQRVQRDASKSAIELTAESILRNPILVPHSTTAS